MIKIGVNVRNSRISEEPEKLVSRKKTILLLFYIHDYFPEASHCGYGYTGFTDNIIQIY